MGQRQAEIRAAGIREVIFFHSSQAEMQAYQGRLPFDCVADFLVEADGRIRAVHYGRHADDQWDVDQLLDLARD